MGRYVKLGMTVASRDEPIQSPLVAEVTEMKAIAFPSERFVPKLKFMAQCGSADCSGCYAVGEGRKIHPPKCGRGY
jgi:hypothetical protein